MEEESGIRISSLAKAIRSLDSALKVHLMAMNNSNPLEPLASQKKNQQDGNQLGLPQATAPTTPGRSGSRMKIRRNTKMYGSIEVDKLKPPEAKRVVTIRVLFMKIGLIDTIHDRYSAEILIQSKWKETKFDKKDLASENIDWDSNWTPKIGIENAIGELKTGTSYSISFDKGKKATVCETRKISGQYFEFMELNQFPFDHQDLTVTVVSELDVSQVEFQFDQLEKCGINSKAFSAEQEWSLETNVSTWKRTVMKTVNKMTVEYPSVSVAAKASRRPQFFIWNIIVIMMAICSLAFATFTVNLETPQFRLQLTYILLLTTVTFKFVVNKSLPKISYLTYLDKYILGSMVILCGVCIWHAVIGSVIYTSMPKANQSSLPVDPPTTGAYENENENITTSYAGITTQIINLTTPEVGRNNNCQPQPAPTPTSPAAPGYLCTLVDKIALVILGSIYVIFHLIFLALIYVSRRDEEDDVSPENDEATHSELTVVGDGNSSQGRNGLKVNIDQNNK